LPAGLLPTAGSARSEADLSAGALADVSCEYELCGLPGVRGPLPAAPPVLAREELCPARGCGSGWGRRGG